MNGCRVIRLTSCVLIAYALVGCSKAERTGLAAVDFARIGGESLSAADVKNMVEVLERINLVPGKKKPRPYGKWSNRKAALITPQLAYSIALNKHMVQEGVEPTKQSDATVLERYSRQLKKRLKTEGDLAALLGELGSFFHDQFVRESRFEAYMTLHKDEFSVKDREVDAYYRSLTNQVKRCARINAKARAKIQKAWDELTRGVAWDVVATNYSEDAILEPSYADNWKDWVQVRLADVHNKELLAVLPTMSVGGFTKPIETEEGAVIARLANKEDELYSLARILVRMAVDVKFPDRAGVIRKLESEKRQEFTRIAMSNAAERVKIEFPLGREFHYQIWPEESTPKRRVGPLKK